MLMCWVMDVEAETLHEITPLIKTYNVYVLFSGGKDSLVALHIVNRVACSLGKNITAVYVNTTASIPDNIKYVRKICRKFGVKLQIVQPKESYFDLVRRWGFPTIGRRWCCFHLKIEPLKIYFSDNLDPLRIVFDGIRADESARRQKFPRLGYHKHFESLCYHPIFYWTDEDVRAYAQKHGLFLNPLYELGFMRASECWCPVFKTLRQFQSMKQCYPEFFRKLVKLESELRSGGSMIYRNGRRIYLRDI